jgi:hypothetical protein
MPQQIFFSWQSDTPGRVGRNLIEQCLKRAIGQLKADADVDPANRDMTVDSDTRDVPGSPPIMETIFGKIDRAAVFVADLTYVAERRNGERSPNPNVCIEHGYALKSVTWRRLIAVMNTAFGHPDEHDLPFDVRHTRRPIMFDCPANAEANARQMVKEALTKELVRALRAIIEDKEARAGLTSTAVIDPHPHDVELLAMVRRQLSPPLIRFLREHDFGSPILMEILDPLHEMNSDWVGSRYEFHDTTVQAAFEEVRRLARELCDLVVVRIYAMNGNPKMGSPKTDVDAAHGLQQATRDAIRDMNERASQLSAALDNFDRTARNQIRVATNAL